MPVDATVASVPAVSVGLDRTFEAVVADARGLGADDLHLLRTTGMYVCLVGDEPDVTKFPPQFDSEAAAARWLALRGITGDLILVVEQGRDMAGDVPQPHRELSRATYVSLEAGSKGRQLLSEIVAEQVARRRDRRVPGLDEDPAWTIVLPGDLALERVAESLGALANGYCASRAANEECGPGATPLLAVQGVYSAGTDPALAPGPMWTTVRAGLPPGRRVLDLRTGVLARTVAGKSAGRSVRFVSAARRHVQAMRWEAAVDRVDGGDLLSAPAGPATFTRTVAEGGREVAVTAVAGGAGIALAARELAERHAPLLVVERLAACVDVRPGEDGAAAVADERLAEAEHVGFDCLLGEHRAAWARRWAGAHVEIDGDPGSQLAARFAMFHLLSVARGEDEAAVGARGLTGPAYGGHVFWDADVYVLPVLAALDPPAARAMLEYRVRRLPKALAAAAAVGRDGAWFPWESAGEGHDVTPRTGIDRHGREVPIRTGDYEEHIGADVAWSACEYSAWTGDVAMLAGPGGAIVVETARYWASRAELDDRGRAHVRAVIGPDEYHELVDDNAFTNVMARWNLRRAAALAPGAGVDADDAAAWQRLADALVDGYVPERQLYEQFAGYWEREPLFVADLGGPLLPADLVFGVTRIAGSQIVKQADVLMLHHLVPDEVVAGSLGPNLDHYLPRTAHGSSLSPAIHASLLARAGRPDEALGLFRLASRLDLDDLTGTTAGGLHLATMGGVWQALAYGFLGLRPHADRLDVDPCLPSEWQALTLRFWFHGAVVTVRADHAQVEITGDAPLAVRTAGTTHACQPGTTVLATGGTR
jgi:trehalose/maltose hydrolase-like predicted phosphorylase